MDRTAALDHLTDEYRELAVDAKFSEQQTTDAYNKAIDMSLRWLKVEENDLSSAVVEQVDVLKYLALLNYYALRRFQRILAIKFDVKLPGPVEAQRSQAFRMVESLLKDAKAELAVQGVDIDGTQNVMQVVRFNLDFLEPSSPGGEFS